MSFLNTLKKSVAAGFMIGIGAIVYLRCENKTVGSIMFTVGLFTVCAFGFNLFTGKIGYVFSNKNNPNCLIIWFGNLIGTVLSMALIRLANPSLQAAAKELMTAKINQSLVSVLVLGFFCGVLMYIAVENYRVNPHGVGKLTGLVFCVSTFILSGTEHSIADMCYAALAAESGQDVLDYLVFILLVSIGNSVGGISVRAITAEKTIK